MNLFIDDLLVLWKNGGFNSIKRVEIKLIMIFFKLKIKIVEMYKMYVNRLKILHKL